MRRNAITSAVQEENDEINLTPMLLIAVGPTGEVWMDGRRIDVRQVKANVVKLLADNPQGSVVIQADEKAMADTIIQVMDGAREAGVSAISLASEPK
jgi:biopolymer transport protein ExbD